MTASKNIAIVGAGIAGITAARTLGQAGHRVTVFEKNEHCGGRIASRHSAFGGFDHGAQYFTVRDARFALALDKAGGACKPWSANAVQVLDELGRVVAAGLPAREPHWVSVPSMNALPHAWALPLLEAQRIKLQSRVMRLEPKGLGQKQTWQIHAIGPATATSHERHSFDGFDMVLLALPAAQARELLQNSDVAQAWVEKIDQVQVAPCWTLMLAFPQAMQPTMTTLGPHWNAARSTHHRIAWLARESSKPGREPIERWTIQASAAWSHEHLQDDPLRVQAKLIKAFAEVTGIRAEPSYAATHRWLYAKTVAPLGKPYLWSAQSGLGVCGDWCLGHRVEDAFVSGLELALAALK